MVGLSSVASPVPVPEEVAPLSEGEMFAIMAKERRAIEDKFLEEEATLEGGASPGTMFQYGA